MVVQDLPFILYCSVHPNSKESESNIIKSLGIMRGLQQPGNGVYTYLFTKQNEESNVEHFEIYGNQKDFWMHSIAPEFAGAYQLGFGDKSSFSQQTYGFGISENPADQVRYVCDIVFQANYPKPIEGSFWGRQGGNDPKNDVMLRMEVPNAEILKNVMDKAQKNTNVLTCIAFPSLFVTGFVSVYLHVTLITEITPLFAGESQLFSNPNSYFVVYGDDQVVDEALAICENMGLKEKCNKGQIVAGFIRQ